MVKRYLVTKTLNTPYPADYINSSNTKHVHVLGCRLFGDMGMDEHFIEKFGNFDYVQLHADFIQDHTHLDSYICFCNEELPKRKKYEQFDRARSFNVWFTNFDGSPFVYHTADVQKAVEYEPSYNVRVLNRDDDLLDFDDDIDQETITEYWKNGQYIPILKDGFTLIDKENMAPMDPLANGDVNDVVTKHAFVYNGLHEHWEWTPIRYRYNYSSKMWSWDDVTGNVLRQTEIRYTDTDLEHLDLTKWRADKDAELNPNVKWYMFHPVTNEWLKVGRGKMDDKIIDGSTVISRISSHSYVYCERLRKWIYLAEPRVGHFILELMLEY